MNRDIEYYDNDAARRQVHRYSSRPLKAYAGIHENELSHVAREGYYVAICTPEGEGVSVRKAESNRDSLYEGLEDFSYIVKLNANDFRIQSGVIGVLSPKVHLLTQGHHMQSSRTSRVH